MCCCMCVVYGERMNLYQNNKPKVVPQATSCMVWIKWIAAAVQTTKRSISICNRCAQCLCACTVIDTSATTRAHRSFLLLLLWKLLFHNAVHLVCVSLKLNRYSGGITGGHGGTPWNILLPPCFPQKIISNVKISPNLINFSIKMAKLPHANIFTFLPPKNVLVPLCPPKMLMLVLPLNKSNSFQPNTCRM